MSDQQFRAIGVCVFWFVVWPFLKWSKHKLFPHGIGYALGRSVQYARKRAQQSRRGLV